MSNLFCAIYKKKKCLGRETRVKYGEFFSSLSCYIPGNLDIISANTMTTRIDITRRIQEKKRQLLCELCSKKGATRIKRGQ